MPAPTPIAASPLAIKGAPRRARAAASSADGRHGSSARDHPDRRVRPEARDRPVRKVGARQRLGEEPAGFAQLERDLARSRELDPAADHNKLPGRLDERSGPGDLLLRAAGSQPS